jgi:uroporphyrinogen-III synthase
MLPLAGRTVVTTRDAPGRLDSLLAEAGADVLHVPLIEIVDPQPAALDEAVASLADGDWVLVTSRHGARRVGGAVAARPTVRLGAVGRRSAAVLAELAGRAVDIVPDRQTALDLVAAMPAPSTPAERVVVAQADRAEPTLAEGLAARGFDVRAVTAYVTRPRRPSESERRAALAADAVAFASGSAAEAWVASIGVVAPSVVVAIGPTTERVANAVGLKISHVAADHSVEGLAAAIAAALETRA